MKPLPEDHLVEADILGDDPDLNRRWRTGAIGKSKSEALADAPRYAQFNIWIAIEEWRIINNAIKVSGVPKQRWICNLIGRELCRMGVEPDEIPFLLREGRDRRVRS